VGTLWRALGWGLAAGAAGTTALNAVTYLDVAIRGRPSSETPQQTVERISELVHVPVPGDDETRQNRLGGLGPLSGILAGLGPALALAVPHAAGWRPPAPADLALASGLAMVAGNGPMAVLGVTDPRRWSAASWLSDVLPHLAYGTVAAAVLRSLSRP
jgi:hypothetical protein